MSGKIKDFVKKYPYIWAVSYFIVYMIWFVWLESRANEPYHVIHFPLDDYIPFCEYFIIPYLSWFAYVAFGVLYFYFKNKDEYFKLCTTLFTGMTVFLIISTLYPNGHYLRPTYFDHNNICIQLVKWLYATDTPTNLFPSIHVYNSLAIYFGLAHSKKLQNKKWIKNAALVLTVCIILSTMFLKQHSVFDVVTGTVLAVFMYSLVYNTNLSFVLAERPIRNPRRI